MDSSIVIVSAFITGLLGPLIAILVRYYLDKNKRGPDMMRDALETSEKVLHKLDDIKEEYGADRVWLSQFHNGGYFYPTGKSIAKFSIVYETVSTNVTSLQGNFQNIPVSLFSRPLNTLIETDVIEIPDYTDETAATYGLKYVADSSSCKSSYFFAIKTIDDKLIGIMCVDFVKRKIALAPEDINHLSNQAAAIGGVLNNHLTKK